MKPAARRIVCATDFSPNAVGAADVAGAIALRLRATLVLAHVAEQAGIFGESTKDFRIVMRKTKAALRKEAERLRRGGVEVEEVLLRGHSAALVLAAFIAQSPPLLVVISSVSKTAFDRWTIGSVSEHVAQHSPAPTLVVRAPGRLLAWAQQDLRLNALVGVDFTVSSDAALACMRDLRRVGACAITAAYTDWPPDEQRWSPAAGLPMTSNPPPVRQRLLRELRRKVGEFLTGTAEVRLEPNWGRPDAALVHMATESNADLVVVGVHQRHGVKRVAHSSVSRGVLRHAPMSVLCVPVPLALAHGAGHHPRIERVLAASDLSPSGDQAIPWAYATVAAGGVVKLVHVAEPREAPARLVPGYVSTRRGRNAHRLRFEMARDKLAALVPTEAAISGIQTEIEIVEDRDPAHGVGVAVRQFGPDVICLSTGERSIVAKAGGGSVVQDVVAQNTQPVLLVKPEEP